jgi:hypothetical protein
MDSLKVLRLLVVVLMGTIAILIGNIYQAQIISPEAQAQKLRAEVLVPVSAMNETERKEYINLVRSKAVDTKLIDVTSCMPDPVVSRVSRASNVSFSNKDRVSHRITFSSTKSFLVPAHSAVSVRPDFGKGNGVYGFGCDKSGKPVGVVVLSN